jgi:ribosomal protein L40E
MEFYNLFKIVFSIVIYIILSPVIIPILLINEVRWNKGVCRKCNSDRYYLDFRPDKFINHHYVCKKCGYRFLSSRHRIQPSDNQLKTLIRGNKINKIL